MTDSEANTARKKLRQADRWYLVYYLRVFDGRDRNVLGYLVDISEKGLMLICENPLEVNGDYRLRLRLPNQMKDHDEIIFSVTCRWCQKDANPDFYLVGFQMHDLAPKIREIIVSLIREFRYGDKK
ncbi:PilZ domain-containing protein [Desulfocastanea catecholica]